MFRDAKMASYNFGHFAVWREAITWIHAELSTFGYLVTNLSEIRAKQYKVKSSPFIKKCIFYNVFKMVAILWSPHFECNSKRCQAKSAPHKS